MRAMTTAALAALAMGLGGCITVFPKAAPVQLYAFGTDFPASAPTSGDAVNVMLGRTDFERAAGGDRILTVTGQEEAYVADSRWISPAAVLFQEAEARAFAADGGRARLVRAGETAAAPLVLQVDVPAFQVLYPGGANTAPTVLVQVHAVLIGLPDRKVVGERTFTSRQPIAENRMGEVVKGFDAATVETLGQLAAWTSDAVAARPAPAG